MIKIVIPEDIKRELRKLDSLVKEYNVFLHKAEVSLSEAHKMNSINNDIESCIDRLSKSQNSHFK